LSGNDEGDIDEEPQEDCIVCDFGLPDYENTADAMDADSNADADADADVDADAEADADADADPDVHDASPAGAVQQESSSATAEEDAASSAASNKPRRSPLNPDQRKQAAETRKIKACTRCRMQKMRVSAGLDAVLARWLTPVV
jgi:hypothetical protein